MFFTKRKEKRKKLQQLERLKQLETCLRLLQTDDYAWQGDLISVYFRTYFINNALESTAGHFPEYQDAILSCKGHIEPTPLFGSNFCWSNMERHEKIKYIGTHPHWYAYLSTLQYHELPIMKKSISKLIMVVQEEIEILYNWL